MVAAMTSSLHALRVLRFDPLMKQMASDTGYVDASMSSPGTSTLFRLPSSLRVSVAAEEDPELEQVALIVCRDPPSIPVVWGFKSKRPTDTDFHISAFE